MPPGTNIRVGLTLTNQFTGPLTKATSAVTKFGSATSAAFLKSSISARGFLRTITNVNRILFNLKVGLVGLGTAFAGNRLITFAGNLESIRKAFESITKNKGLDPTSTINKLREASRGLASDFDLFKFANQALGQNSAETEDQLAAIVDVAVQAAQSLGRSLPDALQRLTLALATSRIARLDEINLVIDATIAYQEYADAVGKNGEPLTELESRQAFTNKVFRTARTLIKALPKDITGLATSYGGFISTLKNIGGQVLLSFGPTLAKFFLSLSEGLTANRGKIIAFFADLLEAADRFFPAIVEYAAIAASAIGSLLAPLGKILEFVELNNLKAKESTILLKYNALSKILTDKGLGADRPFSAPTGQGSAIIAGALGINRSEFERAYTEGKDAYIKLLKERVAAYKGDKTEILAAADEIVKEEEERQRILQNIAILSAGGRPVLGNTPGGKPGFLTDLAAGLRAEETRKAAEEAAAALTKGKGGTTDEGLKDRFIPTETVTGIEGITVALLKLKQAAEDTFTLFQEATLAIGESLSANIGEGLFQIALRTESLRQNLRNLTRSILEDIGRIATRLASEKLIGTLGGLLGGLLPAASQAALVKGGLSAGGDVAGAAAEGLGSADFTTGFNPELTYSKGGIANRPSIFGEAGPEAAVPLSGGRKIPVDLSGQVGSTFVVAYYVNTIDAVSFDQYFRAGAVRNKKALGALAYRSLQQK